MAGERAPGDAVADALLALDGVTRRLRRDCPWDREQDERSIVPHTVEEAYELADAAQSGDDDKLLDELGDVLFQVHFLALLLEERGRGDLREVARGVTEKLIRRHPHVFGDGDALAGLPTAARTPAEVKQNWDAIKRDERAAEDPLAGIPESLPALMLAAKLQRRTGREVEAERALASVRERAEQAAAAVADDSQAGERRAREAPAAESLHEAVGALLSSVVELARAVDVDPELALRRQALATARARR